MPVHVQSQKRKPSSGWSRRSSFARTSAFLTVRLVESSSCSRNDRVKSDRLGTNTSQVEVVNISALGFWLFLGDRELFVPFREFPWFVDAPVSKILNVQRPQEDHVFWPDLDVDLSVESIEHPERFPLMYRERV